MICCTECFNDLELKPIIEGLGKKGHCSVCGCKDANIYDTDIDTELRDYFDELISTENLRMEYLHRLFAIFIQISSNFHDESSNPRPNSTIFVTVFQ